MAKKEAETIEIDSTYHKVRETALSHVVYVGFYFKKDGFAHLSQRHGITENYLQHTINSI